MLSIPKWLSLLTPLPLLLSYFPLVTCLPATLPGLVGTTRPSCASIEQFPAWYQPSARFDAGDCGKAINLFKTDYVDDHKDARYEFLASGVEPVRGIPTQRVPLRISSGTCGIVIAMRSQFKKGELPNETPFRSARSDISSFQQLYHDVLKIDAACSAKESQPGWIETGDLHSIGVFIFQSASEISKELQIVRGGWVENLNLTSLYGLGSVDTA